MLAPYVRLDLRDYRLTDQPTPHGRIENPTMRSRGGLQLFHDGARFYGGGIRSEE
jgi:hypothetical protein